MWGKTLQPEAVGIAVQEGCVLDMLQCLSLSRAGVACDFRLGLEDVQDFRV